MKNITGTRIKQYNPLMPSVNHVPLRLPLEVAENYHSPTQRIRVMTEHWVGVNAFCPNCGSALSAFEANKPVADFFCQNCAEQFELKSKGGAMGNSISDGAYATKIARLESANNPNLFFLRYDKGTYEVRDFLVIPKYFFLPSIIKERHPLAKSARRAGWVGSNIIVREIPDLGKIYLIQDGVPRSRDEVLDKWSRTAFVRETRQFEAKGWLLDVLKCVEMLKKPDFTLEEMYRFEPHLQQKHPLNNNIQAKIRQQLQFLRDRDLVEFLGRGRYRLRG